MTEKRVRLKKDGTPAKKTTPAARRTRAPAISTRPSLGGQPTLYRPEYDEWAEKLAKLGATDKELAEAFEVAESTVANWKNAHPTFLDSIKKGRKIADAEVASKLFHRATGYEHPEDDIKSVNGAIVITPTIKHYPPDTTAAIFWLKNRQPKLWRDKNETALTGADGAPLNLTVGFVQPKPRGEDDEA